MAIMLSRLRVAVFTNDMAHFFGEGWLDQFGDLRALDVVIEATKLGVAKPHPEAFRRAAAVVGEPPERCLLVDDHRANLVGATTVGMATHFFDITDPAGSVAALLAALGMPTEEPDRIFIIEPRS
jgi:HAD superfamily hydrolase (TIGR01509 family)